MTEGEDRPTIVNISSDRKEVRVLEIPNLDEMLGERIEGLAPDARAFLKLQMLVRDQDVIGRLFYPDDIIDVLGSLTQEGTLSIEHAQDLYRTASETHAAFREATLREAADMGLYPQNPVEPTKLH